MKYILSILFALLAVLSTRSQGIRMPNGNLEFDMTTNLSIVPYNNKLCLLAVWCPEKTWYHLGHQSTGFFYGFCEFHNDNTPKYKLEVQSIFFLHKKKVCPVELTTDIDTGYPNVIRTWDCKTNPTWDPKIGGILKYYGYNYRRFSIMYDYNCSSPFFDAPLLVAAIFSLSRA